MAHTLDYVKKVIHRDDVTVGVPLRKRVFDAIL